MDRETWQETLRQKFERPLAILRSLPFEPFLDYGVSRIGIETDNGLAKLEVGLSFATGTQGDIRCWELNVVAAYFGQEGWTIYRIFAISEPIGEVLITADRLVSEFEHWIRTGVAIRAGTEIKKKPRIIEKMRQALLQDLKQRDSLKPLPA